jgi:hypothetical protein
VSGRLDDEKLETLRRWGAGLGADGRDELRAAGKAILILIEEIERLQVDVWHMRDGSDEQIRPRREYERQPPSTRQPERVRAERPMLEVAAEEFLAAGASGVGLEPTLRGRLRKLLSIKTE